MPSSEFALSILIHHVYGILEGAEGGGRETS